jgi:hypothetical protein
MWRFRLAEAFTNCSFSYLRTSQSKLLITEDKVIREHAIASVTCLSSGLKVFQTDYPHSARSLRVLKGLHGFHVYASEYWVDYILTIVTSHDALSEPDLLSSVVQELSNTLDGLSESVSALDTKDNLTLSENHLGLLKAHKGLYESAVATLEARSRKEFGDGFWEESMSTGLSESFIPLTSTSRLYGRFEANKRFARCSGKLPGDYQIAPPYPRFPRGDGRGT